MIKNNNSKTVLTILLKAILSGIIVSIFILLVSNISQLLWQIIPHTFNITSKFYILLICLLGGLLLVPLQKTAYGYPKTIQQLTQDKTLGQTFKSDFKKIVIVSLIVLSFGGSVGPEAPLAGIIVALFQWLKVDLNQLQFKNNTAKKILQTSQNNHRMIKLIALISALLAFFVTYHLFNQSTNSTGLIGLFSHASFAWHFNILYLAPLGLLIGLLFGMYFNTTGVLSQKLVNKMPIPNRYQPILGGLILGLVGMYSLNFLFAGTMPLVDISKHIQQYSLISLIILALGKPILTNLGFQLGWRGGPIFPAILASYTFAFVVMEICQVNNPIFALVLSLSATVYVTGSPLIMAIVYLLLYPFTMSPIIFIIAYLSKYVADLLKQKKGLKPSSF